MSPAKRIGGFFVRFLVVYVVLMAPWPGLADAWGTLFRAAAQAAFGAFGDGGAVSFRPLPAVQDRKDTEMLLRNQRFPRAVGRTPMSSRNMAYVPTAFLVALVLATPIPWRRRAGALLFGLVLVSGFAALRLALRLLDVFSEGNVLSVFDFSPFWKGILGGAVKVLVAAPAATYIIPTFIWILVTFRRGDAPALLGLADPQEESAEARSPRTCPEGRAATRGQRGRKHRRTRRAAQVDS